MKIVGRKSFSAKLAMLILTGLLVISGQSVFAVTDYIFFSVNGDTTLSTMTQGDVFFWGANCDIGATVNWEIWFDANLNSSIDPTMDLLLTSENITDGNAVAEANPALDGYVISEAFILSGEPGAYIFKATDIAAESSVQRIMTMVAMPSPPNQFTGQIILPGISAPNSLLANNSVFAESESGEEGAFFAVTDNMGMYTMNIGDNGTGVEFYLEASAVSGFVAPGWISATALGVIGGNDFTYMAAIDSVWGYVKDETGSLIPFEGDVAAGSNDSWRSSTTRDSRYVIYFSNSDGGEWTMEYDSRVSPLLLTPEGFSFNLDTLSSFQHDIVLTWADTTIYARIVENGGLPLNNYRIDAYSALLASSTEAVSGTGMDNIVTLYVSSLDPNGWSVYINPWEDDFSIPDGLIARGDAFDVSPGDTVTLELIDGILVSGNVIQDPEDAPIAWDYVSVWAGMYGTNPYGGGAYSFYADTGTYYLGVYAEGYLTNPESRYLELTADTSTGLDFIINEAHCHVSGTLTNISLPLDNSYYYVVALTGSDNSDGYYVTAQVDSATGTYQMNLCDGNWAIFPPCCFPDVDTPDPAIIAVGEPPDYAKTVDFEYLSLFMCGDANNDEALNIMDCVYIINYLYKGGPAPVFNNAVDVNNSGNLNIMDVVYIINYLYKGGPAPTCP